MLGPLHWRLFLAAQPRTDNIFLIPEARVNWFPLSGMGWHAAGACEAMPVLPASSRLPRGPGLELGSSAVSPSVSWLQISLSAPETFKVGSPVSGLGCKPLASI